MNRNIKRAAALLLALTAAVMMCMTVFASGETTTAAPNATTVDPNTTAAPTAPAAPAVVSMTDVLADRELIAYDLRDYGVRVSYPQLELSADAHSSQSECIRAIGLTTEQLLADGYLVYARDRDYKNLFYVKCESDLASRTVGSYNDLKEEQLPDYVEATRIDAATYKLGDVSSCEFASIDGNRFLHTVCAQNAGEGQLPLITDILVTVQNGVRYTFLIRIENCLSTNSAVLQNTVDTIRLSRPAYGYGLEGVPARKSAGTIRFLLAAVIVLLLFVFALVFLLLRFSAHQVAAESPFNILGVDFPEPGYYEDLYGDDEDEDDDYEPDEDEFVISSSRGSAGASRPAERGGRPAPARPEGSAQKQPGTQPKPAPQNQPKPAPGTAAAHAAANGAPKKPADGAKPTGANAPAKPNNAPGANGANGSGSNPQHNAPNTNGAKPNNAPGANGSGGTRPNPQHSAPNTNGSKPNPQHNANGSKPSSAPGTNGSKPGASKPTGSSKPASGNGNGSGSGNVQKPQQTIRKLDGSEKPGDGGKK